MIILLSKVYYLLLKDVINLYIANASNGSGYITTIAATKDGSFYDLGLLFTNKTIIRKEIYYSFFF